MRGSITSTNTGGGRDRPVAVFKAGGSLLSLPDLADRLRAAWAMWPDHSVLTVVGGGTAVDVVREWDRVFHLGDEAAHWLAIDAMDLSATLVEHLVPELQLVRSLNQMRLAHAAGRPALLCVKCFVKWLETQPSPLPHGWNVTSDSIAAAATQAWNAAELVLLKSRELPADDLEGGIQALTLDDAVDGYFPEVGARVKKISWINLRGETMVPSRLRNDEGT